MLLKHERSVLDITDAEGRTCLHWAAKADSVRCIELLLKVASERFVNQQDFEQVCLNFRIGSLHGKLQYIMPKRRVTYV